MEIRIAEIGIGRYLLVYLCILILQFAIAYQHMDGSQMSVRMFLIAIFEAGLGLMFFIHLWEEKQGFCSSVRRTDFCAESGQDW